MKQIAIVSGKGGTGKTTITASFASIEKNLVVVDCDVDAAVLHLLLKPKILSKLEFEGSKLFEIDKNKCIKCGLCESLCRFKAIKNFTIDPFLCEGCSLCYHVCPVNAITMRNKVSGYTFISSTKYGPMVHARLNAAESNSGKLVTMVRDNARRIAENEKYNLILIDGPPGIGCPVFATLANIDLAIAVAEPTLSGIHDLARLIHTIIHFNVKPIVVVNMYNINKDNTNKILNYCKENNIEVAGIIPFDKTVVNALVNGLPVVEYSPNSKVSKVIKDIWSVVKRMIE